MTRPERIHTDHAPAAIGPYSQAMTANGLLFTAGQVPLDPATGEVVGDDVVAQTERVMENLRAVLEAAGTSFPAIVKTTVYLADMNDFAAMNEVYGRHLADHEPARSTVQAARLPKDVRVEIEAIALLE